MAVGVVAGDAAAEPDDMRDAEGVAEHALEALAPEPGIADLDRGIEVALLGGEQRAPPVDVDAAALQHHRLAVHARGAQGHAERPRRPLGDAVVLLPVRVLGPGVEPEARDRDLARRVVLHEDGPEVARPAAVEGEAEELDAAGVHPDAAQDAARERLLARIRDQDADRLAGRDAAHDLAVDPRDRRELARPVGQAVRPGQPGGLVRLPFRGHAEGPGRAARGQSRNRRSIPE